MYRELGFNELDLYFSLVDEQRSRLNHSPGEECLPSEFG